jgi:hypothetical protein
MLGGLQSRYGRFGKEKNILPQPEIEPRPPSPYPAAIRNELSRLLTTMVEMKIAYKIFVRKTNGERTLGGLGAEQGMILKWMLNKQTDNHVDRIFVEGPVVTCYLESKKHLGPIKGRKSFNFPAHYQLLKKDSTPWIKLCIYLFNYIPFYTKNSR